MRFQSRAPRSWLRSALLCSRGGPPASARGIIVRGGRQLSRQFVGSPRSSAAGCPAGGLRAILTWSTGGRPEPPAVGQREMEALKDTVEGSVRLIEKEVGLREGFLEQLRREDD